MQEVIEGGADSVAVREARAARNSARSPAGDVLCFTSRAVPYSTGSVVLASAGLAVLLVQSFPLEVYLRGCTSLFCFVLLIGRLPTSDRRVTISVMLEMGPNTDAQVTIDDQANCWSNWFTGLVFSIVLPVEAKPERNASLRMSSRAQENNQSMCGFFCKCLMI